MKIDIETLKRIHKSGLLIQGAWIEGDSMCLMAALTGQESDTGCAAQGWPKWLSELGHALFDAAPAEEMFARGLEFAEAVKFANNRDADFDRVFRDIRLTAVLPIAMNAIGNGDELWRVE